ncbi:hypothetical protein [uncultured Eudoraea sp.]|uniref:hypothetical protein n=1 Tax=uncultured Eudoraea sp. TaxID=1035614 RepID=UPI002618574C|nr:hypothetical protein [uncultured Eudoraea sp.]
MSAGVAITHQELILSITLSFCIFIVKLSKPGDRIEIYGIRLDLIDLESIYPTASELFKLPEIKIDFKDHQVDE